MLVIALSDQVRMRIREGVLDYFPNPLTVMDRDLLLSLVEYTLDYVRELGVGGLSAAQVLGLSADGLGVEVGVPASLRVTPSALYRIPAVAAAVVRNLPADPREWVATTLPPLLARAEGLRAAIEGADSHELLMIVKSGCAVRDEVFTSRRRHFLSSFAVKIMVMAPWRRRRYQGRLADDAPTRRLERVLANLTAAWTSPSMSLTEFGECWAGALDSFGGRGESFLPLVSDLVWDVYDLGLRGALDVGAGDAGIEGAGIEGVGTDSVLPPVATAGRGWVNRRLDALATERDWVIYGYEQANRATRLALLRLGERLADYGVLSGPRDVFHLTVDEIEGLVADRPGAAVALDSVALRRERYENLRSPCGSENEASHPAGDVLIKGVSASPGRYVGKAHVVSSLEQAVALEAGSILVCRMTSPSWVPAMTRAGAIVTDRGGALSHAAIVARELCKPTVTGTHDATRRMRSGHVYEVDGGQGTVRLLAR